MPPSQVIYVGDGRADVPCFSLLNDEGGTAIGFYKGDTIEGWAHQVEISESQRVTNIAPADYHKD
ncbi:hypothetical protein NG798_08285 [Ancylothrix sp. C2]|nr:hypothetical protein [Ancylothrix sp. D3o]